MKQNDPTATLSRRRTHTRVRAAAIAALLLGGALSALVGIGSAAAAAGAGQQPGDLRLEGATSIKAHGLMPGDDLPPQRISVSSQGPVAYQLGVEISGSAALAEGLQVRITRAATGETLYEGSLDEVRVPGSEILASGGVDELIVEVELSLAAGNEVQGATLDASLVVSASAIPGS